LSASSSRISTPRILLLNSEGGMSIVYIKSARFAVSLTPKGRGYMYVANNQTYK